jgi:hypothetical protein
MTRHGSIPSTDVRTDVPRLFFHRGWLNCIPLVVSELKALLKDSNTGIDLLKGQADYGRE